ncbi:MAG: hypothetical protein ABEI54_04010, partial [Candidatus Bipolaricaulia bacterium]
SRALQAPTNPGRYQLTVSAHSQYSCEDAITKAKNGKDTVGAVGTVQVKRTENENPQVSITDLRYPKEVKVNEEFIIEVKLTATGFTEEYAESYAVVTAKDDQNHDRALGGIKVSGSDSWTSKLKLTAPSYGKTLHLDIRAGLGKIGKMTDEKSIKIKVVNPSQSGFITAYDPSGDTTGPRFTDIRKVSTVQASSDMGVLSLEVNEPIRENPSGYIAYVWALDTDLNKSTGQSWNDTGSDYNLRVAYHPGEGWSSYLDNTIQNKTSEVGSLHFANDRKTVSVVFPLEKIDNPTEYGFTAHVVYRGTTMDVAPDQGHKGLILYY